SFTRRPSIDAAYMSELAKPMRRLLRAVRPNVNRRFDRRKPNRYVEMRSVQSNKAVASGEPPVFVYRQNTGREQYKHSVLKDVIAHHSVRLNDINFVVAPCA